MNSFGSAFLKGDRLLLGDPSSATIFVAIIQFRLPCRPKKCKRGRGWASSVAQFRPSETDALA